MDKYAQPTASAICPNGDCENFLPGSQFCNVCGARLITVFRRVVDHHQAPKQAPQRYTIKQLRRVGLGLVLGAFLFLLFAGISAEAGVLGLFLFVVCLVPGFMLLGGFVGEPDGVGIMREAAAAQNRQNHPQYFNIAPREFRYRIGWLTYGVSIVLFMGFFLAGLLFLAVAVINPSVRAVLVFTGLFLLALGGLGLLYLYRTWQMNIRVDSWGLRAVTLFGVVEIAWNEVVTLEGFDIRSLTYGSFGQIYRVYSLHKTLEFSQNLEKCEELIAIIDCVTRNHSTAYKRR